MPFQLLYHPDVREIDIPKLNRRLRHRISKAIEERLGTAPHKYGDPLRKTLKGYWKLRVGDYRVVYRIVKDEVWILAIVNRKDVYERVGKRV